MRALAVDWVPDHVASMVHLQGVLEDSYHKASLLQSPVRPRYPECEVAMSPGYEGKPSRCAAGRMIRPAHPDDAERLRSIELAAGARFREVGMTDIAEAEPMAVAVLATYAQAGRSWVAVDDRGRPVGYVVVDVVDSAAHIEQISVDPDYQGRGLCRALIDEVERWAAASDMTAMTLTTFDEVPWNRSLYEHLGFAVVDEIDLQPGLREVREAEARHGLDPTIRVCMQRVVDPRRLAPPRR